MTSKGAKETLVSKLGFKSSSSVSKAEAELDKVKKENSQLRKKIDELAKRHIKPPDSDKSKLLERILSLENLRERNNQQLLVKEQELETLRQQLSAREGENGQVPPANLTLQDQLKDALEKNQQWLVYDQQREAYVQSVVARTQELEQQLNEAMQQQTKAETTSETSTNSSGTGKESELKSQYEKLLSGLQKDLEFQRDQTNREKQEMSVQKEQTLKVQAELQFQREQVNRVQEEMSALRRKYEDKCSKLSAFMRKYDEKCKELDGAKIQLQAERVDSRYTVNEERKASEHANRIRAELESTEKRLEGEKIRSAKLLMQVNMLQKSLLSQNEEWRRIAALEQQIRHSTKDFEIEKIDRQSMQQQLQKVLEELRKARDQIAKLESAKQPNASFSEPCSFSVLEFDRMTTDDPRGPVSPSKVINLLDESFLECPKCHAPYPTSRHRELLAHIDDCFA